MIRRRTEEVSCFNLKHGDNYARFPLNAARSVRVSAGRGAGTWTADDASPTPGAAALSVVWYAGTNGPYEFASAKDIPAGGGSVSISATELEGVSEVRVVLDAIENVGSTGWAEIVVSIEEDIDGQQPSTGA